MRHYSSASKPAAAGRRGLASAFAIS